jgi:hypothetical protein
MEINNNHYYLFAFSEIIIYINMKKLKCFISQYDFNIIFIWSINALINIKFVKHLQVKYFEHYNMNYLDFHIIRLLK